MPLEGEYAPSTSDWARKQAEAFEASNGTKSNTLRGMPVIVVTSIGAKSGKVRKTPLMRVEHDGEYAAVASLGGAPQNPVWYYNLKKRPSRRTTSPARSSAKSATSGGNAPWPPIPITPITRRRPSASFRSLS